MKSSEKYAGETRKMTCRLIQKRPKLLSIIELSLLLLLLCTCGNSAAPGSPASEGLFTIRVCRGSAVAPDGEIFKVLIRDPNVVAEAQSLIDAGMVKIIDGPLVRGDGGFNQPWSWHIDPDDIVFVDTATEVCDGCPSFVENNLEFWLANIRNYCPFSTEVLSRER